MNHLSPVLTRAMAAAGLAALGWSGVAQAQTPTVFNACVTPLTGLLYQPKEAGKCFLPSHQAIRWTDGLGAFLGATSLGGDLSGTLPNPTVNGLRGHPVSAANPTTGQILIWDGSVWAPGNQLGGSSGAAGGALTGTYPNPALAEGVVTSASLANESVTEAKLGFDPATQGELDAATATATGADVTLQTNINTVSEAFTTYKSVLANSEGTANSPSNPLSWTQLKDIPSSITSGSGASGVAGGDLAGNYPNPAVVKLRGTPVSSTAPTNGQVLAFNGTSWAPAETPAGGSGTTGQNSVSRFGSGGMLLSSNGQGFAIPGLSATIDVPANSVTIISTDGGVQVNSTSPNGATVVAIVVVIDNVFLSNGGQRRVVAANTSGIVSMIANWSIQLSVVLPPGSHTIHVFAEFVGGNSPAAVSGPAGTGNQGELTLTTLKR